MPVEVICIDHIFIPVRDLAAAEAFYDKVMPVLGFRKGKTSDKVSPRARYDNRHLTYWIVARDNAVAEPGDGRSAPSHLCFRVVDEEAVDRASRELRAAGIEATEPQAYTQYSPDYYATFFSDPDGLLLEVINFNARRRRRMFDWDATAGS
ncbi:MAG: VOC family protein [Deltaproteobacteria bacterium]|nr:VOC family protein [Deltaproteobacteria bacterium]